MFWDDVEINVAAGKGGDGLTSFRQERGEAKGGPDGGDGGHGGSVVIAADPGETTLVAFARRKRFQADSGKPGGKGRRHGKSADDLRLTVPVGTVVYQDGRPVADLTAAREEVVIAKGGRGGFGNAHFTSATRQTPRHAERGEPGEEAVVRLELKLVADIGLVGIPSVGKSTFLSRVSAAKPKIADYPFTTTVPQLGIAMVDGARRAVADIPGLIEGAHRGKGLGDAFLRHVERTRVIIHLLDATADDPVEDYRKIRKELAAFGKTLPEKPEVIGLNKIDTVPTVDRPNLVAGLERRLGQRLHPVSAASGEGVRELLRAAVRVARKAPPPVVDARPTFTLVELAPRAVRVTKDGDGFRVTGPRLERLAAQTDFERPDATDRFWWIAHRMGVGKRLQKLGAEAGATVRIGGEAVRWPGTG